VNHHHKGAATGFHIVDLHPVVIGIVMTDIVDQLLRCKAEGACQHGCETNQQADGVEVEATLLHYGSPIIF